MNIENRKQLRLGAFAMALLMALMVLVPSVAAYASPVSYDDQATQVLENIYKGYLEGSGQIVGNGYAELDGFTTAIVGKAGADVLDWNYDESTKLGSFFQDKVDSTLTDEGTEEEIPANHLAKLYYGAKELGLASAGDLGADLLARYMEATGTFTDLGDYDQYVNLPVFDILVLTGDLSGLTGLENIASYLLGKQVADGSFGDFQSTTQAVRVMDSLKDLLSQTEADQLEASIQDALVWIRSTQEDDGSFVGSQWDDPVTNSAEVVWMLDSLGLDEADWQHGDTALGAIDYLASASYDGANIASSAWALYAFLLKGASPDTSLGGGQDPEPDNTVTIRIEGPDHTILPETQVQVEGSKGYTQILIDAADGLGYTVQSTEGFLDSINEIPGQDYWSVTPYQENYGDGDSFVIYGGGSGNQGELELSKADPEPGETFHATVRLEDGTPLEGARVIYYTDENMETPVELENITDADGRVEISIQTEGSYKIAAHKINTAPWPEPDNGLIRTMPATVSVEEPINTLTIRIEGPDHTILPETQVQVEGSKDYTQILIDAADGLGYTVQSTEGFIDSINDIPGQDYWWITPYQETYGDGDSFVFYGGGSGNQGELELSKADPEPGETFHATVKIEDGTPLEGARVIYYTDENMEAPVELENTTDADGRVEISIQTEGSYKIAAHKINTAAYPEPDNGLIRTMPATVSVEEEEEPVVVEPEEEIIRVEIAVMDDDGDVIYGPRRKRLGSEDKFGLTALGALEETGLDYDAGPRDDFVEEIEGISNRGLSGWMYAVNGRAPKVAAIDKELRDGDEVLWFYSTSNSARVPDFPYEGQLAEEEIQEDTEEEPEAIDAPRKTFADVGDGLYWARDAIELLAGKGIIQGTGDGDFEPYRSVNRAEFIKLAVELLGDENKNLATTVFTDVDLTKWYADYISKAFSMGLIEGSGGKIRPMDSISRFEVAAILHRMAENRLPEEAEISFADADSIPVWARLSVSFVVENGLFEGYEDNTFRGDLAMTRAEAALIIYRYMEAFQK